MNPAELDVKLFADGADRDGILALYANPLIRGFTTNPTLMRKAGIEDYEWFARDILQAVPDRPFSLEVFADEHKEMERQALKISAWGDNVYVKIPVTNTRGEPTDQLLRRLSRSGVKVNVTALMTSGQVARVARCIEDAPAAYVSVFAGRVADSGRDPIPIMRESLELLHDLPRVELIWASPRELLNVIQAHEIGCDIITVTHDVLSKLSTLGKDLDEFSLDTVRMFHRDAAGAQYSL
ncbi:MAG TPA: transaldolase [Acidimicrobiia bacterium]|nr:transaldolase [Acidimicrobiia bacterium]